MSASSLLMTLNQHIRPPSTLCVCLLDRCSQHSATFGNTSVYCVLLLVGNPVCWCFSCCISWPRLSISCSSCRWIFRACTHILPCYSCVLSIRGSIEFGTICCSICCEYQVVWYQKGSLSGSLMLSTLCDVVVLCLFLRTYLDVVRVTCAHDLCIDSVDVLLGANLVATVCLIA